VTTRGNNAAPSALARIPAGADETGELRHVAGSMLAFTAYHRKNLSFRFGLIKELASCHKPTCNPVITGLQAFNFVNIQPRNFVTPHKHQLG
jgi:hypothetical protein